MENSIISKLDNLKTNNKLHKMRKDNLELTKNSKLLFKEYKEYIEKLNMEINNLKKENETLKRQYEKIPKFIRKFFK